MRYIYLSKIDHVAMSSGFNSRQYSSGGVEKTESRGRKTITDRMRGSAEYQHWRDGRTSKLQESQSHAVYIVRF